MGAELDQAISLQRREALWLSPETDLQADIERIYGGTSPLVVGRTGEIGELLFSSLARPNTFAVAGAMFGDEGKGRIVDNLIKRLLDGGSREVYVVRDQGGNNAGHSVEKDGLHIALHVIPSFVMYSRAKGIMDKGEIIHPEDLHTEYQYVEEATGESLAGRLFLSRHAILCTDLERAEEAMNAVMSEKTKGTTLRGIGTADARRTNRTGFIIRDLMRDDWREKLGQRYDDYAAQFKGLQKLHPSLPLLADVEVPDFRATKLGGEKAKKRKVGSKEVFLKRLSDARDWLIASGMVVDTDDIYRRIHHDTDVGIIFEGSQAAGLDVHNGAYPDVTSSDTTITGIKAGTGYWVPENLSQSYIVAKAVHTSSVGAREMPTLVNEQSSPEDRAWAAWVQKEAHEFGTSTGRPRDVNMIDMLAFLYFLRMSSGGNTLSANVILTHLDIAKKDWPIKLCYKYTDAQGNSVPFKPDLEYLSTVTPHYIELPSWDGTLCRTATKLSELPLEAQQYLAFIQARTGYPIVATTTGPDRDNLITFPGFIQQQAA